MCVSAGSIGTSWVVKGGVNLRLEHTHITRKAPFSFMSRSDGYLYFFFFRSLTALEHRKTSSSPRRDRYPFEQR